MVTAMTARLIFELPLPENIANARLHWAKKDRQRRAYFEALDAWVTLRRLPKPPKAPWLTAIATVELRTLQVMDADNAHARTKWCFDWLQTRGYIMNDRDVVRTVEPTAAGSRTRCGITLTLEPLSRAA
jgi:hypothetical protein